MSRTIHPDGEPLSEPSPYTQYVLQDDKSKEFWTGENPQNLKSWTEDIDQAKAVVGLEGVTAARREVDPVFEYTVSRKGRRFRHHRITYFRCLREPAERKAAV